jgi:hypothetical protein
MSTKPPWIAAGFALLTTLVASPPPAGATFKRQAAAACTDGSQTPQSLFQDALRLNVGNSGFSLFFCGLPEDSALRKEQITRVNLTGIDGNTTIPIFARACVGFSSGTGGQCDATVTSGPAAATGPFNLAIPHTTWNVSHAFDIAYIQVAVPPFQMSFSGISSVLYGN